MVLHPSGQEARRRAGVVVGLIAVMAATMITGCSADNGDAATRDSPRPDLQVVTTVSPLTSIVANIAGPDVAVTGLVPEGVNSHTFEPPPSAARALAEADIVLFLVDHSNFDTAAIVGNARLVLDCRHRLEGPNVEHL